MIDLTIEYLLIILCVFLSSYFSSTETALTSLSIVKTKELIDRGSKRAKILNKWLNSSERILTTTLIGNNLVNIMASIIGARIALAYLGSTAYTDAVAVGFMTFIILVLGEIIPKTLAKHHASKIAIPFLYILVIFEFLFLPLVWLLSELSKVIVFFSKGQKNEEQPAITEEEIEYLIKLAKKDKVFSEVEQGELLHSAMQFPDTVVKEIMVPRTKIDALEVETSLDDVIEKILKEVHSRIPVYDKRIDVIIGILYVKDLFYYLMRKDEKKQQKKLEDIIRKPPFFVPETQKISDVLKEMQKRRVHLAIVVDEFGGTSGIITLEDILEELVGEIRDELDIDESDMIKKAGENKWIVDSYYSIYDLGEILEVKFPDSGDYESLGGFLISFFGSVPKAGTEIMWNNIKFTVLKGDEKHIQQVEVVKIIERKENKDEDQ